MTKATLLLLTLATGLCTWNATARAETPNSASGADPSTHSDPALEVNVLWPFFPGGFTDFKLLLPTAMRGELVLGLHSDFGWRNSREDDAGKVAILAGKFGYRQFFLGGLHVDSTINTGWRQERDNPFDGTTLNAFVGRWWTFAGYQHDLSERWYANARAGLGVHLWRTDRFGAEERVLIPAGDINVGVRL
jgi:hypothetical protein